jgi:hypothetical protein
LPLQTRDRFIEADICRTRKVVQRRGVGLTAPHQNLCKTFARCVTNPLIFAVVLSNLEQGLDHIRRVVFCEVTSGNRRAFEG